MANIELVIKIPEENYENLLKNYRFSSEEIPIISLAIATGTPLPKGHGRIADIDKILEEMKATRTYDIPFALERVKPIIEADKAENEDK